MTFFSSDNPIKWPEIGNAPGAMPPDPDEDVIPEEVEALIRRIEDQASRLRNAAEVHFMRKRYPGYRNRSHRRHTWTNIVESIWGAPLQYAPLNVRGITVYHKPVGQDYLLIYGTPPTGGKPLISVAHILPCSLSMLHIELQHAISGIKSALHTTTPPEPP